MIRFYAVMCVLGTVLPYGALIAYGVENGGFDIKEMVTRLLIRGCRRLRGSTFWSPQWY